MLTAALVAPHFINWTGYRADFEREASAILGRQVTVKGDAQARLLPFPSVTFSDVAVAGAGDQPAMTVETFSMDSELAPFLRGEFLIFDMRLTKPKAVVEVAENGAVDWIMRPAIPFESAQISVEKLTVTDGQIEIRHGLSGRTHRLTAINTQLSAKSLAGPWRLDGSVEFDGAPMLLAATTGAVDENGQMRLRVKTAPSAYPLALDADGQIALAKDGLTYSGTFRLAESLPEGANGKSDRVQAADAKQPAVPPFRVNGAFALTNRKLDIGEFRFETGPTEEPYTADGAASLDFGSEPRFAVKANGSQVRFDEAAGAGEGARLTLQQRLAAVERTLTSLPKPTIPGSIEVNLPAVVAGDTTIRDVVLAAEPAKDGWILKAANATLPGRTTLEASGLLRTNGEIGFNGSLLLAVGQPSGFAAWLAKDIDEAIRRLPSAGFSANVEMSRHEQLFRDLELVLGKAKFKGEVESRQPADQRPSVVMKLDGGMLDVDGLSAFASLFVSDAGENRFAQSDLDFQVKAGPIKGAGVSADSVDTAMRLRDGHLEIDRLAIGGLAGASVSATGSIKDFPTKPNGNVDASVVAVDLAPLVKLLSENFADNFVLRQLQQRVAAHPALLGDARLDIVGTAAANDDGTSVTVSANGEAGGSALSISLSGSGHAKTMREAAMKLSLSARNEDAAELLALAGLPVLGAPLTSVGAGEMALSAEGVPARGLNSALRLTGEGFNASFDGVTVLGDDGFTARGKTAIDAEDIEPWLTAIGTTLPGMGFGSTAEISAEADLGAGLLVLDGIEGVINENAVAGDLNVAFEEGKPSLNGALVVDALSLDPFAAMILGESALTSETGGWPSGPFARKANLPLTAALEVSASTLSAGSLSVQDASFGLRIDAEGLRINELKAGYGGGALTGRLELKNTDGTGLVSSQVQLSGFELGGEFRSGRRKGHRLRDSCRQWQVDGSSGRIAVGIGHGRLPGPRGARHQWRCAAGAAGACRRGGPRHRCRQDRGLRARDRRSGNLRRRAMPKWPSRSPAAFCARRRSRCRTGRRGSRPSFAST